MKSIVLFLLLAMLSVPVAMGQIKIGDNPQNIDAASVLELESSNRVLVITRANTTAMQAITPQRGGLVYNTDTDCVHYYDGTQWVNLCDAVGVTFSNEHIVNTFTEGPSIEITQNANNYNFEVALNSIRSEHIVDGGINGDDIQDNSIGESKLGADSVSSNELRDNSVGSSEVIDGSIRPTDLANTIPDQVLTTDENGIPLWQDSSSLTTEVALDIAQNAMDIADHLLNDNDTDSRNELTDISFDKLTNTLSLTRSETAVGQSTDLSSLIGSDDQELTLTADNRLQIENGNEIDLNIFNNSGSDNQTLSLNGNTLAISGGNDVSLTGYVNTDNQALSIVGNTISLTNGGSVDLPPGTVDTDEQNLTLTGNTINITNGTGVDLTPILGSGADGVISQVEFAGTDLTFTGAGGGFNGTVSLAGLGGGTADGALTNVALNGTDLEFTSSAGGFTGNVSLATLGGGGSADGVVTGMQLQGTDLVVTGTAPGFSGTIPLGTLAGTDNQELTLEPGNLLTLANGGTPIDLTPFLDDQTAGEVTVAATAANYTPTSADVEGHLAGIDASLATTVSQNLASVLTNGSSAGNNQINDLTDPTLPQDAATLNYVETRVATILASGGVDGVITNVSTSGTGIDFLGSNGGFSGSVDLDPTFVTEAELATAITASETADGDTSATNEIQTITSPDASVTVTPVGNNYELTVAGGGTDDQNLESAILTGSDLAINIEGGDDVTADLSALTTDLELAAAITASETADGDTSAANEIQNLTLTGNNLAISGGNSVTLPAAGAADWSTLTGIPAGFQDGTDDDTTLDETAVDAFVANNGYLTAELDADPTNEIQNLTLTGNNLAISGGNSVTLPAAQNITNSDLNLDADRTVGLAGNSLVFGGSGSVGIGIFDNNPSTSTPALSSDKLHVSGQIRAQNGLAVNGGTNGQPSYSFFTNGDSDTGMYRIQEDFLGFSTNGTLALTIDAGQNVITPGNVTANSFISATTTYPDYVFQKFYTGNSSIKKGYKFTTLSEVEKFVKINHHLPGVKSAKEIELQGNWNLTEGALMNLEKIEELFLHTIEQEKKIQTLTAENEALTKKLESLQNDVEAIKQVLATKNKE